ncbi:MAG: thioredoxin family protein, partial [Planctomycetota bacterium]
QDEGRAGQTEQLQNIRQRWQNMSEEEREKFRAEMRQRRQKWESMSEEEKEEARAQMRQRFGADSVGALGMRREAQLKAIEAIEGQVAKLKAVVKVMGPVTRSQFERAKLREKMMTAMRERQSAIRAVEQQIAKLRGSGRPGPESRARVSELKSIHKLAVKEKATETARRLEKLIAGYQSESEIRPPRQRPVRQAGAGRKAKEFTLKSFDGKTVSLSDYKGKTVVLEWFNFECPFVMHHYDKQKTMVELARKYKNKGVVWLTINSTNHTTPAANKDFTRKHNLPFPILDDRSGEVGQAYSARTTPHMYIIAPTGNIVYEGAIDNSPLGKTPEGQQPVNYVDKALAELTSGNAVSTPRTNPYGCTVKYAK